MKNFKLIPWLIQNSKKKVLNFVFQNITENGTQEEIVDDITDDDIIVDEKPLDDDEISEDELTNESLNLDD
jgi:hypothetical protein